MDSVRREAVEGARLHGNTFCVAVGLLRQVEGLEHPESWKTATPRHQPMMEPAHGLQRWADTHRGR